jgi:hypothetical protein
MILYMSEVTGNSKTGWSLALREEHRHSMFENRVLRRIFGPKNDKMIGG